MFDRLLVRNRRTAFVIVFALWLVGNFVAFPGFFAAGILLYLFTNVEDPMGLALLGMIGHAGMLLFGPVVVARYVPRWILKLAGDSLRAPQSDDFAIRSTLDTVAAATGRPAPSLLLLRDTRPNACALQINGSYTIVATTAACSLKPQEREALLALALSRTLTASRYFDAVQNWVLAPIVAARMIPHWVYVTSVGLLVMAIAIMANLDTASTTTPIFLGAAFSVKMPFLSHVVVRRGFDIHVKRAVVLSQDAKAVSLLRYPPAFRLLLSKSAQSSGQPASKHLAGMKGLPIWVLPNQVDDEEALLRKRLEQLDRIDPLGAATDFNAQDVPVLRGDDNKQTTRWFNRKPYNIGIPLVGVALFWIAFVAALNP